VFGLPYQAGNGEAGLAVLGCQREVAFEVESSQVAGVASSGCSLPPVERRRARGREDTLAPRAIRSRPYGPSLAHYESLTGERHNCKGPDPFEPSPFSLLASGSSVPDSLTYLSDSR